MLLACVVCGDGGDTMFATVSCPGATIFISVDSVSNLPASYLVSCIVRSFNVNLNTESNADTNPEVNVTLEQPQTP